MITPRRTRLVRVRDLREFRDAIAEAVGNLDRSSSLMVVPTVAAADQLRRACRRRGVETIGPDDVVTRDELYERLLGRLQRPPCRLSPYERDAIAQASAREAAARLGARAFHIRPGLVADMLRFYDELRRQRQTVARFEELLQESLEREADIDRGARRMLEQTRLLASVFREYERRVEASGACDEHVLRNFLLQTPAPSPLRSVVVTVADWIADPHGLFAADFDMLTRLPGLETLDVVTTDAMLASGFHERIHEWLPGLDERRFEPRAPTSRPTLGVPGDASERHWFLSRDREEELIGVARRLKSGRREQQRAGIAPVALDRVAVVYRQPLPYLYVAREVFGGARMPYQTSDTLPLAAEPFAAALDLVFEFADSAFSRDALVALLRSPHFEFRSEGGTIGRHHVTALDRKLSDARYLGELEALTHLADEWRGREVFALAMPALDAAVLAAQDLAPLRSPAPASIQIDRVLAFLAARRPSEQTDARPRAPASDPFRERRARAAILSLLAELARACRTHDDVPVDIESLGSTVRRAIESQTFAPESPPSRGGVQLLDDDAARFGDFDEMTLVGLIEGEWPQRGQSNIFYPSALLSALGWPSERDARSAAEARFLDLLTSPSRRLHLSTITLDDEALVEPATLLDDVPRAGLSTVECAPPDGRIFVEEALSLNPVEIGAVAEDARPWAEIRATRDSGDAPAFHGQTAERPPEAWSVSAIETYLTCPFKFFAQHVLKLEEEPEDEEVMDPRGQGRFMHKVFEAFFARWQEIGRRAIDPDGLDDARKIFEEVVERHLCELLPTEAALERTRLLGSSAAAGLGDAVMRMEAERPVGVVERLLEYPLRGEFVFQTASGPRTIPLKGRLDRLDLLDDGTFRVIDYKLGWAPRGSRALQLPIYSLCAGQRLEGYRGRSWALSEAAYLAFKGPRRVVSLFQPGDRDRVLADAQQRLVDAVDAIGRGEFPPRPVDVWHCETCAFSAVCRKDYVGDL